MRRRRIVSVAVVALLVVGGCASTAEETSTPLRAGPLPRIPGPALDRPVVASAGDHVVVWGGHGGGRYRAGGWVIDGDRQWRRITATPAAMHGMIRAGAVWTGDDLIVMGMRCDLTDAAYKKQLAKDEDANACEGNPRIAVRIDPRTERANALPPPEDVEQVDANGAFAVGWDGAHAWFQVDNEDYSHRLVGLDPVSGTWSTLDGPRGEDLERACVVGGRLFGVGDPDGVGTAVAPSTTIPSLWSRSTDAERWSRRPTAPLPVVGPSLVRLSCAAGAVMGNRCGAVPATAAFDLRRDRWRAIPSVPSCTDEVVAAVGPTLVTTKELGELVARSPGEPQWRDVVPDSTVEVGFDPVPSVYRSRLLLVAEANQYDGRQMQLRLVDVTS